MIPCSFTRRLLCVGYDALLLLAVLFAATAILLPFTGGEAIHSENLLFFLYLLGWSFIFFAWQWTHGGQTLGMRTWKVMVATDEEGPLSWKLAGKRFLLALVSWFFLGTGFLWALFNKDKLALHDQFSGTRLYKIESEKAK